MLLWYPSRGGHEPSMPAPMLYLTNASECRHSPRACSVSLVCALWQSLLASIRHFQQKLQDSHERSKTVTRSADMKVIRNNMQVGSRAQSCPHPVAPFAGTSHTYSEALL